jgi:hypothetical protein
MTRNLGDKYTKLMFTDGQSIGQGYIDADVNQEFTQVKVQLTELGCNFRGDKQIKEMKVLTIKQGYDYSLVVLADTAKSSTLISNYAIYEHKSKKAYCQGSGDFEAIEYNRYNDHLTLVYRGQGKDHRREVRKTVRPYFQIDTKDLPVGEVKFEVTADNHGIDIEGDVMNKVHRFGLLDLQLTVIQDIFEKVQVGVNIGQLFTADLNQQIELPLNSD